MGVKARFLAAALLSICSFLLLFSFPEGLSESPPESSATEAPDRISLYTGEAQDLDTEQEIPREPETTWSALDGILTVSVQQPTYPVGIEEITVILRNDSSGEAMYGVSYSVEKYVDSNWENVSGDLAFDAVGRILSEHNQNTMTVYTTLFPTSLGVGLYRIIGTTLSYTEETGHTSTTTDCYVVEFLITEDATAPTEAVTAPEDCWLSSTDVLGENEFHFSMKDPYSAGLRCTTEDRQDILIINIYDRSTGERLTAEPLRFQATYPQDIYNGPQGEILIESQGQLYTIDVVEGQVVSTPATEPFDPQIPHEPVTETETFYGEITIAMEQASYAVGTDAIAFTVTNNTKYDMTTESFLPCSELFNWAYESCFRTLPEGDMLEVYLSQEPETIELKAGETCRFVLDLSQWYLPEYTVEGEELQAPLGRGLYTMSFSRRTFSFSDSSDITAALSIEFVLE